MTEAAIRWEPLFEIADLAGDTWPDRARQAALVLSGESLADDATVGVKLFSDIRGVWRDDESNVFTSSLLTRLADLEESPWGDWYGKQLAARGLAKLLRRYGVRSRKVRLGDSTRQGYRRADLEDPWSRYLAESIRNTGTTPVKQGVSNDSETEHVSEPEPGKPPSLLDSSDVPEPPGYTAIEWDEVTEHVLDLA